ncbi:uncharacterized protein SPSK_03387 [Sporothrix schenckii 1099-18]|uniref:Uncharacterized protein n=1 Tax=Sporothrix schenckii 1099-18 TaxID=1397361 RepID=A0A0F2M1H5_SPOSC|nr:uncharacterized protein SPSK_03387 [Sporothrix schenckii 1099-18]KJR82615.1 hypothetical protein SPSK_03387 [Sporothrix schenckii 1099-18]
MSRQGSLPPAFPPTPEDETGMAQLHPDSGRAKSTQGITPVNRSGIMDSVVDTPTSPSSSLALSRFEFEYGKGNEGTKVLMVEWDCMATESDNISENPTETPARQYRKGATDQDWVITWEGKDSHNVLAAASIDANGDDAERRMYFLLPPGATIPHLVSITRVMKGGMDCSGSESKEEDLILWTKPMPAIYPTSLGSEPGQAGRWGVLHTLWARQKLASLEAEIEAEMKANSESVGLQIALQEQDWISTHFGVSHTGHPRANSPYLPSTVGADRIALSRSPIGGKLGEKLSGLRLATSPTELVAALHDVVDVPMLAAIGTSVGLRTSIEPHISGHGSLDAVIGKSQNGNRNTNDDAKLGGGRPGTEDDLFALPLSPRSPEMARSPFSLL